MIFRNTSPGDWPVFHDEIRRTVEESPAGVLGFHPPTVQALLANGGGIVCEVDGQAVGCALISMSPSPFNPGTWSACVYLSVVLPAHRGKGVGLAMVREIERICAENRVKALIMMPPSRGDGAHATLNKEGFHPYKDALIKPLEAPC